MGAVIEIRNLTKTYGTNRGVDDISLTVPAGSIFGFLGPNGAGKTTTISMLVNLTKPTRGQIKIFGKDIATHGLQVRKEVGYLSSDMGMDGHLSGWQQLEFFQHLRGIKDHSYIEELAERLDCNLNRKIKTLSRGNRQKVALISALMHKPKLLILDEPTSGLDPLIQAEFNKIILEHKSAGKTAFVSSHVLSEVQEICDEVAFIRGGRLIAQKNIKDADELNHKVVTLKTADKKLVARLKKLADVSEVAGKGGAISFIYAGGPVPLLKLLAGTDISDVQIANVDLETTFMRYYQSEETEDA